MYDAGIMKINLVNFQYFQYPRSSTRPRWLCSLSSAKRSIS